MDSFAYYLAWAILAIQATLVLFLVRYIVGRVVGFGQFLWQEYVWPKIRLGWRKKATQTMRKVLATGREIEEFAGKNEGIRSGLS